MRNSHIAVLCILIVLLLASIAVNVLVATQYSKRYNSSICTLFVEPKTGDDVQTTDVDASDTGITEGNAGGVDSVATE